MINGQYLSQKWIIAGTTEGKNMGSGPGQPKFKPHPQ